MMAWECPMGHAAVGSYKDHVRGCKAVQLMRASLSSNTVALVPSIGNAQIVFDSVVHGVRLSIAFKDGSALLATVPFFCPPALEAVLVDVVVSDVNVAVEHKIVITSAGPVSLVPLPTIDVALYCVKREVAVRWIKRVPLGSSTGRPSSSLLRPLPPPASPGASSGSGGATGSLSATSTEKSIAAVSTATSGS